MNIRL